MAGDAVVGALRVVLGMDVSKLEEGVKKADHLFGELGKIVLGVFGGTTLTKIVEKVFERLVDLFKETVTAGFEFADQMGKMAQKVGVGVEQLTSLKVAAELSDVSMESLSGALGKLSKSMVDAAHGNAEARAEFAALGVAVTDSAGKTRSVVDVLADISDKFHNTEDGAGKVAAVLKLMGKGAKDIIPLLNEGSGNLKEFTEIAHKMHLTVSEEAAASAQKLNDNFKILGLSTTGISNIIAEKLSPGLIQMTNYMVQSAKGGDTIEYVANLIIDEFKTIVAGIIQLVAQLSVLGSSFKLLYEGVVATISGLGDLIVKGFNAVVAALTPIAEAIAAPFVKIYNIIAPIVSKIFGSISDVATAIAEKLGLVGDTAEKEAAAGLKALGEALNNPNLEKGRAAFDEMAKTLAKFGDVSFEDARVLVEKMFATVSDGAHKAKKSVDDLAPDKFADKIKALGLQAREAAGDFNLLPKGFAEAAVQLGLTTPGIYNLGVTMDALKGKALILADAMAKVAVQQDINATKSPFAKFKEDMDALEARFPSFAAAGEAGVEAFYKKQAELQAKFASQNADAARLLVGGWAEAFKTLAEQNKQYAGVAKALAIVMATINTYEAATKAMASTLLPYPLNLVAAAGTIAAGLAQVAKISSTNFATGGSFRVGGTGGIDSQLIHFNATPGEMVDIRKPGQGATLATEVTINGLGPEDLFSGRMLRGLVDSLNAGDRDGYRLRFSER